MNGPAISNNVYKRENPASANVLMCKQWWKVCWMYGDQEKYYRQLYGKRSGENIAKSFTKNKNFVDSVQVNEAVQSYYENTGGVSDGFFGNESFSLEEVSSPSPNQGRNSSPGLCSLEIARGLDE